jgi:S-adenosylmethionine/arginine decarboxylase-like enzyme
MYGPELILDLFECDVSTFNRKSLRQFSKGMCKEIGMTPHKYVPWDDDNLPPEERQTEPKKKGYSAIQFLMESSITIHALELLGTVYINVFSCKGFDVVSACQFARDWFKAKRITSQLVLRG